MKWLTEFSVKAEVTDQLIGRNVSGQAAEGAREAARPEAPEDPHDIGKRHRPRLLVGEAPLGGDRQGSRQEDDLGGIIPVHVKSASRPGRRSHAESV